MDIITEMGRFLSRLPLEREHQRIPELTYPLLKKVWNSPAEYHILKTQSGIVLVGGRKHEGSYSAREMSQKYGPVLVNGHSHPYQPNSAAANPQTHINDCFSMQDYLAEKGEETSDLVLTYPKGVLVVHFSPENISKEVMQQTARNFVKENQETKKYVPNKEALPDVEKLFYILEELRTNNPRKIYELQVDLEHFLSEQKGISIRRYDLSNPQSEDVKDFLNLYNNGTRIQIPVTAANT